MARQVTLGFFLLALVTLTVCNDFIDIDGVLNNRHRLGAFVECLMDRGTCSPDGQTLKNKMARQVTLGFFLLAMVTLTVCVNQEYPSSLNFTELFGTLNNRDRLGANVDCLLDRGTCSTEGQQLKDFIPMAVDDLCGRCTPRMAFFFAKAKKFFMTSQVPGDRKNWDDILAKYHIPNFG